MNITSIFKFNYVYITTNLVNNKKYIGKHSTNDLNDGYLGSGILFKKAIKKYGKDKFQKEILFIYDDLEMCLEKEKELITMDIIESQEYYNLKGGGEGGVYSEEVKLKISNSIKASRWWENKTEEEWKTIFEKERVTREKNGTMWPKGKDHPNFGKEVSIELRSRISNSLKGNIPFNKGKTYEEVYGEERSRKIRSLVGRDTSGEKNPAYGRIWLKKNNDKKYPVKDSLEYVELINRGWVNDTSVCNTTQGYVWIANEKNKIRTYVLRESEDYDVLMNDYDFLEKKGVHLMKEFTGLNKKQRVEYIKCQKK